MQEGPNTPNVMHYPLGTTAYAIFDNTLKKQDIIAVRRTDGNGLAYGFRNTYGETSWIAESHVNTNPQQLLDNLLAKIA